MDSSLKQNMTFILLFFFCSASNDNVRLWNTEIESTFTIYPEGGDKTPKSSSNTIPFTILPGHHGGTISHIGRNDSFCASFLKYMK